MKREVTHVNNCNTCNETIKIAYTWSVDRSHLRPLGLISLGFCCEALLRHVVIVDCLKRCYFISLFLRLLSGNSNSKQTTALHVLHELNVVNSSCFKFSNVFPIFRRL